MKTEIDEVEEPFNEGKVGSSTMPHKRNPAALEGIINLSKPVRYNAALMMEDMMIEHERDTMSWRGNWLVLPEVCNYLSVQLKNTHYVLQGLVVKPENMLKNLNLKEGLLLSERVMFELGEYLGKQTAHDLIYKLSQEATQNNESFRDKLFENETISENISEEKLEELLDPSTYLGEAPIIVDKVIDSVKEIYEKVKG